MEIKKNIFSVGVVDEKVRIFHGYETPIGTTYNSYLVLDEQITLIDFVKRPFADELLQNIKNVIGSKKIDNIICNHVEPDHSGALPVIISEYPDAVVHGTAACKKELEAYYPDCKYEFITVGADDTLCTGEHTFKFIPMPMVHWPDSMSTYLESSRILFSNDALGQHIGSGEVTDDDLSWEKLLDRAADYYANIVLPFGFPVSKLLAATGELDIQIVCPSHGVILKNHADEIIKRYSCWCKNEIDEKKLVIVYDTMWGTTRKMAYRLEKEYMANGFTVELISLSEKHYSHAMTRLLEAKYIFVGSPTLNNEMLPTVAAFLTYMKGLKPKNRIGKAFGSYGWSGESVANIHKMLESAGFEMLEPEKANWNI